MKAKNLTSNGLKAFILTVLTLAITSGCGVLVGNPGDDDEDGASISGNVVMGPVGSATVNIYLANTDGTEGSLLGTTITDEDGAYKIAIESLEPLIIVSSGGSYEDEATGDKVSISSNNRLRTMLAKRSGSAYAAVNGLTTIAAERAKRNSGSGLESAISQADAEVAALFGMSGVDIKGTKADNPTKARAQKRNGSAAETRVAFALAGLSQLLSDDGVGASYGASVITAIAEDFADGGFDGMKDGEPLSSSSIIEPEQAMNMLGNAMRNFADSGRNQTGLKSSEIIVNVPAASTTPDTKPGS